MVEKLIERTTRRRGRTHTRNRLDRHGEGMFDYELPNESSCPRRSHTSFTHHRVPRGELPSSCPPVLRRSGTRRNNSAHLVVLSRLSRHDLPQCHIIVIGTREPVSGNGITTIRERSTGGKVRLASCSLVDHRRSYRSLVKASIRCRLSWGSTFIRCHSNARFHAIYISTISFCTILQRENKMSDIYLKMSSFWSDDVRFSAGSSDSHFSFAAIQTGLI